MYQLQKVYSFAQKLYVRHIVVFSAFFALLDVISIHHSIRSLEECPYIGVHICIFYSKVILGTAPRFLLEVTFNDLDISRSSVVTDVSDDSLQFRISSERMNYLNN